jgi:hypothetical protein
MTTPPAVYKSPNSNNVQIDITYKNHAPQRFTSKGPAKFVMATTDEEA